MKHSGQVANQETHQSCPLTHLAMWLLKTFNHATTHYVQDQCVCVCVKLCVKHAPN